MPKVAEKEPGFRRAMYALLLVLLVGYLGFKAWHLSVAFGAWEDQPIVGPVEGAAK